MKKENSNSIASFAAKLAEAAKKDDAQKTAQERALLKLMRISSNSLKSAGKRR